MAQALGIFLAALMGMAVASFLNVVADRVPRGQSIVSPPSHCPICAHELRARELVPVLSYLALRGRCGECGAPIPRRVPLAEAAGGAIFALVVWHYGATLDALLLVVAFSFLLVVAIIDLEHKLVLDKVLLVGFPVALAGAVLWSADLRDPVFTVGTRQVSALLDALAAGTLGLLILLAFAMLSKGGMGGGDVKLTAVLGFWLGLRLLPVALMIAVVAGGIFAIFLLTTRLRRRRDAIPFAPFLCGGAAVSLVWGEAMGDWFLNLITG